MDAAVFAVAKYSGRATESAEAWLNDFEQWIAFHGYDDDTKKKAAFTLSMTDQAHLWINELPADKKDTYQHLRDAFRSRFGRRDQYDPDLWDVEQGPGESVEDYLIRAQQLFQFRGINPGYVVKLIEKGLSPLLRSTVQLQNPKTMDDLISVCKLVKSVKAQERKAESVQATSTTSSLDKLSTDLGEIIINLLSKQDSRKEQVPQQNVYEPPAYPPQPVYQPPAYPLQPAYQPPAYPSPPVYQQPAHYQQQQIPTPPYQPQQPAPYHHQPTEHSQQKCAACGEFAMVSIVKASTFHAKIVGNPI